MKWAESLILLIHLLWIIPTLALLFKFSWDLYWLNRPSQEDDQNAS